MTIAVTIAWTERTYTMNQKIKLLQDAYAKVGDGLKIYNQYCRLCGLDEIDKSEVQHSFNELMAVLTTSCENEVRKEAEAAAASAGSGVLRVRLYGGSGFKDVTMAPPDGKSKIPYIGEAAYNAVCFALGTRILHTKKDKIAVLKPNGRLLLMIRP